MCSSDLLNIRENYGAVYNCYSTGSVSARGTGRHLVGGFAGYQAGGMENCYSLGTVEYNSLNENAFAGGIIGQFTNDNTVKYCYWNSTGFSAGIGKCSLENYVVSSCGSFSDSSQSITAGKLSNCLTAQTLTYTGNLLTVLNSWVTAKGEDSGYYPWKIDASVNNGYPYFDIPSEPSVSISGSGQFGTNLTAELQDVTGDVTYAWYRDNTQIAGETASTYTIIAADICSNISCKVSSSIDEFEGTLDSGTNPVTKAAYSGSVNEPVLVSKTAETITT